MSFNEWAARRPRIELHGVFFFSSRRRHTRCGRDWSSDVCSSDLGNIQIHTGPIRKTMWHQEWYNIMDPDFNMHLDMSKIAQTWIVRKPTEDGVVTSIEVFNEMGDIIVQFFGKRKPGIPELEIWRETVAQLA